MAQKTTRQLAADLREFDDNLSALSIELNGAIKAKKAPVGADDLYRRIISFQSRVNELKTALLKVNF